MYKTIRKTMERAPRPLETRSVGAAPVTPYRTDLARCCDTTSLESKTARRFCSGVGRVGYGCGLSSVLTVGSFRE